MKEGKEEADIQRYEWRLPACVKRIDRASFDDVLGRPVLQPDRQLDVATAAEEHHFFAGSNAQTILNTFSYVQTSQPQQVGTSSVSPLLYLFFFVFIAIGALLVVLEFPILTRRIWR